jgi:rare lipoprotein A (peptidoglycan hydrolase)
LDLINAGGINMKRFLFLCVSLSIIIMPCIAQQGILEGLGSWYNTRNPALMASHSRLPFGTQLRVTNLENNRQVLVKVGGRIHEASGILVDMASPAATLLQMNSSGWTPVRVEIVPRAAKVLVNRTTDRDLVQEGNAMRLSEGSLLTVGHPSLPEGSRVLITNLGNGYQATATVMYRIRASRNRIVEISDALGERLGIDDLANVRIESIAE